MGGRVMRRAHSRPCLVVLVVTGCSGGDEDPEDASSASPSATPSPVTATEQPFPKDRDCYLLGVEEAVAPTADLPPVDCSEEHTSITYAVGRLDNVADGHLLAVDSQQVQDLVATACPEKFAEFAGGSTDERRLSMLRAVWFTPTVEESDLGAEWYRCDAIVVAADGELAPLSRPARPAYSALRAGRDRYGMCGTTAPDDPEFERVICSRRHSWRAIATVDFEPGKYPGVAAVRSEGQDAVRERRRRASPTTRWTTSGATSGPPRSSGSRARPSAAAGRRTRSRACAAAWGRAASPWRS